LSAANITLAMPTKMKSNNVAIAPPPTDGFDIETDTLIIGAGACGLVAALAAVENNQSVVVIEADAIPSGSTALSAGLIPAANTRLQRAAGVADSVEQFAQDIQNKAHNENSSALVNALAGGSADVIEWLIDNHHFPFSLIDDFDYPGHTHRRMHGLPSRSGAELINTLRTACEKNEIDIICNRRASIIFHEEKLIKGVSVNNSVDQSTESIACKKLILACNGFGGNSEMVSQYMPEIENALWFGHSGNLGDAITWGEQLGATVKHLSAFQGHGNVAHPHGILITWAVITQGGIQVNVNGERFWDESQGYSEAARAVLSQPDGIAYAVFDERIATIARQFEDFKQAEAVKAVVVADTVEELAAKFNLPVEPLFKTLRDIPVDGTDIFGRVFGDTTLTPPYCAVRVTGALFHTQGGLDVNKNGQIYHSDGGLFPNLFAGGGAACGVSGNSDSGYLSGNGLLSAIVLGFRAGAQPLSNSVAAGHN